MPNESICAYLRENKEKFPRETLLGQLRASGYPEADIAEGASIVYGEGESRGTPPWNFWDFQTAHTYRSSSEKTRDALFGFFVPIFFFVVLPLGFLADIFFLVYFWNRRRFIAYGVLDRWAVLFGLSLILGFGVRFFSEYFF